MLNKVILMGRMTAEPDLKRTMQNTAVCSFTLAVNRSFSKDKAESETDFIDIVTWRNTAEFVFKYFTKGQQMAVCGRLQTRTWQDKQGNKRKSTEVVADEVHFAEGKKQDNAAAPYDLEMGLHGGIDVGEADGDLPF